MRLTGPRRGNPAVRFMVEQTARRRMWSALGPSREASEGEAERQGTLERAGEERRWSRAFFESIRASLLPRMAPVAETPEGRILYYGSAALCLWAVESPRATALAYEYTETPAQIRERARRWLACLGTRTAPGLASPHWGHPVYGARLDPLSDELDVVWAVPGEWTGAVLASAIPEREWDQPRSWAAEGVPAPA